jgi:hypothetical protein
LYRQEVHVMKPVLWTAFALTASLALGDQLVILGQTREGSFQGFENGRIDFQASGGKFVKEQSTRVTKLVLTSPLKASYQTTGGKREEDVTLKGFEKGKFAFAGKDGKEVLVPAMQIRSIEPVFAGAAGGGGDAGERYPIPPVDLSTIAGDLAPDQQAALDGFRAAKKAFDDFVAESSALVQEMDRLKGPKREERLNQLRLRKDQEQPLRQNLIAAYRTLTSAFADAQPDEPAPAERDPKPQPKSVAKPATRPLSGLKSLR